MKRYLVTTQNVKTGRIAAAFPLDTEQSVLDMLNFLDAGFCGRYRVAVLELTTSGNYENINYLGGKQYARVEADSL